MHLNVVTLNIPYPPDYGGMIDSFYRLKWLKAKGVRIHLHCFEYGRQSSAQLDSVCETIKYYPRDTTILNNFSPIPYIVKSRSSEELLKNLLSNDFPILFDGLHTTYFLKHPDLRNRKRFVRLHNIEHQYYRTLADIESHIIKKFYFQTESRKLKIYERNLSSSANYLTISSHDQEYFRADYDNVFMLPPSHPYEEQISLTGKGDSVLFHGDLSVRENSLMAEFLSEKVFSKNNYNCIIAGKNPPDILLEKTKKIRNISIKSNPSPEEMEKLIINAHINLLPATSNNGFKMKSLVALYAGRFCIVNNIAASNYEEKSLFHIADSPEDMISQINYLMNEEFTEGMINERKTILNKKYSNQANTERLIDLIYNQQTL
jgi:hypothetical protein